MTTENKSVIVNGVEVEHPVVCYVLHKGSGMVVACKSYMPPSGTVVEQGDGVYEKGHFSDAWTWPKNPYGWENVIEEWRIREQQPYTQERPQKTSVQESESIFSVLDEVALKLLPMVYQIVDADTNRGSDLYMHDDWPTTIAKCAYKLAEAFMEEKHARDNKPIDTQ